MKRLSTIVFLCGMVFVANVFAMSEEDKEFYRDFVSNAGSLEVALAMDETGFWNTNSETSLVRAKKEALKACKKQSEKPATCKIVDVNGNSDFIKTKGMAFPVGFKFKLSSNAFEKGEAYRNGEGVATDYKEAVRWYKLVADENSYAAFWTGIIYDEGGYGVTQDYDEAFKWYMKGADMGNSDCQFMVGVAYEYGGGVSEDLEKAVSWYLKSAEQGDPNAKDALKRLNVKVPPKSSTSKTSGGSDR